MKGLIFSLVLILVFLLLLPNADAQCAMCRATVENNASNGETGFASKLNAGILYLFVAPYLAISVVAFFWYKNSKKNAKKIKSTRNSRS